MVQEVCLNRPSLGCTPASGLAQQRLPSGRSRGWRSRGRVKIHSIVYIHRRLLFPRAQTFPNCDLCGGVRPPGRGLGLGRSRSDSVVRALGEDRFLDMLHTAARNTTPLEAICLAWASSGFFMLAGLLLLVFHPRPAEDWGFWYGTGIIVFGFAIGLHTTIFLRRLFRTVAAGGE